MGVRDKEGRRGGEGEGGGGERERGRGKGMEGEEKIHVRWDAFCNQILVKNFFHFSPIHFGNSCR
jgi:hypothetical protein